MAAALTSIKLSRWLCWPLALMALVAALVAALTPALALAQEPIDQAEQLMVEGRHAEAYQLLAPLEFDYAGEPRFDLLFGFVALEAGEPSIAALALERVLAIEPTNEEARLHLARSYLALNDDDSARRAFEQLLADSPNQRIRATVGRYLEGIAAGMQAEQTFRFAGYVQLQSGLDTNSTSAPSDNPLFIPINPGQLTLSESSLAIQTLFTGVNLGGTMIWAPVEGWTFYAGGDFLTRQYARAETVNFRLFAARTGAYRQFGNNTLRFGLTGSNYNLDGDSFRNSGGGELEYLRTITARLQASVLGSYTTFRHVNPDAEIENFDSATLTASALYAWGETSADIASLAIDVGNDDAFGGRTDGDRRFYGVRASVQKGLTAKASLFAAAGYQSTRYDRENFIFLTTREERQVNLSVGGIVDLGNSVSIRPSVSWLSNDSGIALYDYDRWVGTITLQGDFF